MEQHGRSSGSSSGGAGRKRCIVYYLETRNRGRRKQMCNTLDLLVDLRLGLSRSKQEDSDIVAE